MMVATTRRFRGRVFLVGAVVCLGLSAGLAWFAVGSTQSFLGDSAAMLGDIVASPPQPVPGRFVDALDEGSYLIAVRTSSTSSTGPFTVVDAEDVEVGDVIVTDPDGRSLELRDGANNTVQRNEDGYSGVVIFDVVTPGEHEIWMETAVETDAIVVRSFVTPDRNEVAGLVAIGLAVLSGFGGLVLLLAAAVDLFPAGRGVHPESEPDIVV